MSNTVKHSPLGYVKVASDVIEQIDVINIVTNDVHDVVTSKAIYEALSKLRNDIEKQLSLN